MKEYIIMNEHIRIEDWDDDIMEMLLNEFETQHYSLDEHSWDEIQDIKYALWIGYKFIKNSDI